MPKHLRGFVVLLGLALAADFARGQESGVEFFEKKIRPVLVEHCYPCHSRQAGKERGGLLLDSRDAMRRGGDNGPTIVPGKPAQSLLIQSIRHARADLKMPKAAPKLPPSVIADFERWVELGAPDPRELNAVAKGIDFEASRKHWAYQPIRKPEVPRVKFAQSAIDALVLAKLGEHKLQPSPRADARTMIRRLTFDLIGLPPTFEEVENFTKEWEAAKSVLSTEYSVLERLVDRLLASPHYGERWARHWLDVARYADTKDGVLMYGDDRVRPYAYTYRDYVIRAFNDDTPFDRFIHEQLAADAVEPKVEPWRLSAMGFLTLGRQYDNNIHDVIDDRIDTVTRGFLGLTVACARCHDHKYDAIPTADYYSLYGVFANSEAPLELPLADRAENCKSLPEYEKLAGPHREKMQKFVDSQYAMLIETAQKRVGDYLVRVATTEPDLAETAIYFLSLAPTDLRPPLVNAWRKYLAHPDRAKDPVFGPWSELMKCREKDFAKDAVLVMDQWNNRLHPQVRDVLLKSKLTSKTEVANAYGKLLRNAVDREKRSPEDQQLVDIVVGKRSPGYFPKAHTWLYLSRSEKDAFGGMRTQFDKIALKLKDAPPRAMVLLDANDIAEHRVFVRGNAASPGDIVPRQFLRVLAGDTRKPFANGSGRLDLAKAIASKDNPLTARVLVNRVWMHHFGEPLVATPSDFGARSSPPSHPELLDWLAAKFIEDGWSLKKLHKRMVLSATYLQASADRPEARKIDPENRLYWRANRRRLDLEAMRDGYLMIAGRLDRTMHGRPVDIVNDAKNARRTVYGLVDRQSLPNLFRVFDFAVPDQSVERRPMTTVPQQALFGLNSPFMLEQAKALAARSEKLEGEARVQRLYQLVFARQATGAETAAALRFLNAASETSWTQYAQVLLLTNEALFVD